MSARSPRRRHDEVTDVGMIGLTLTALSVPLTLGGGGRVWAYAVSRQDSATPEASLPGGHLEHLHPPTAGR